MIELGVSHGPAREHRSYSDTVVSALVAAAAGTGSAGGLATGAVETCAGQWARALAAARVTPARMATAAVTPALLADVARRLIRTGDSLHVIEVTPAGVRLVPASHWDVRGDADPATWLYHATVTGPTTARTRTVPAAGVVHVRWATDPLMPWRGVGPLQWARQTGRLAGELETALADETAGPRGHVLPVPEGQREPDPDNDGDGDDPLAEIRGDLDRLKGGLALVESMAGGYGDRAGRPDADWKAKRIGADPPVVLDALRSSAALSIFAAAGVPPSLVTLPADGTGQREAWRRFLHGSVSPVARLVESELREKLEVPDLRLAFDSLYAADVAGRARAWRSLAGKDANVDPAEARRLAGLE